MYKNTKILKNMEIMINIIKEKKKNYYNIQ